MNSYSKMKRIGLSLSQKLVIIDTIAYDDSITKFSIAYNAGLSSTLTIKTHESEFF